MIHWLIHLILDHPERTPLRLFTFVEFRAVLAIVATFFAVILGGKPTIRWLLKRKIGDNPEFDHADLNELMKSKANVPTMGGMLICASIGGAVLLLANLASFYVIMALVCLFWMFIIGAVDDYLKLTTAQRSPGSRHGLRSHEKLLFQVGVAMLLGIFTYYHAQAKFTVNLPDVLTMSTSLNLPFLKSWEYESGVGWVPADHLLTLGIIPFVVFAIVIIAGFSNAVNLTDGMDGLASGVMVIVAFAFMVLCIIAGYTDGNTVLAKELLVPYIPFSEELAVVAGAMVGACLGFLWFNCSPAQVFMGDSGSLPLGGLLGYMAVAIRQELLLVVIGGVFVMEAVSVILQVGYFKLSKGKRVFLCAPIHHHFHLKGWTEQQVVVRFWLITVMLAAIALVTIRLR